MKQRKKSVKKGGRERRIEDFRVLREGEISKKLEVSTRKGG